MKISIPVKAGDILGKVGGTPKWSVHLHYQISSDGVYLNSLSPKNKFVNPIYFYPSMNFTYNYNNESTGAAFTFLKKTCSHTSACACQY